MKLSFKQWNKSDRNSQAIIFLHGMGGTGALFRPITAFLENKHNCIAPDQRGHGDSRTEEKKFSSHDYALDIVQLIQDLGLHSVGFVGHSMGVRTALATVPLLKIQCMGLIAADLAIGAPFGGGLGPRFTAFIQNLPEEFPTRAELKTYLDLNCPDPSIAAYLNAAARPVDGTGVRFPFSREALKLTLEQASPETLENQVQFLAQNQIPALFLRGEKSLVWSKQDFEIQKNKWSPFSNLKFEEWANCSHGLPFEQRAKFVETVDYFFAPATG